MPLFTATAVVCRHDAPMRYFEYGRLQDSLQGITTRTEKYTPEISGNCVTKSIHNKSALINKGFVLRLLIVYRLTSGQWEARCEHVCLFMVGSCSRWAPESFPDDINKIGPYLSTTTHNRRGSRAKFLEIFCIQWFRCKSLRVYKLPPKSGYTCW